MMDAKQQGATARNGVARLGGFLERMAGDRSGAAAVFFAICLLLLAPLSLGLVNIYLSSSERSNLQDALDAAALYVARTDLTDAKTIDDLGKSVLLANLGFVSAADKAKLVTSSFVLSNSKVTASAEMIHPEIGPNFFDQGNIKATAEVTRNANNLEVAIVLDTTGSMDGSMDSLKLAANELVSLVVKDVQTPYYSKAAIIPYSVGVNLGSYAEAARGAARGSTNITKVTVATSGTTRKVTVTSAGHGLANGEHIVISGVKGMTEINKELMVADAGTDTFILKDENGSYLNGKNYNSYSSAGTVQCLGYGCATQKFTDAGGTLRKFGMTNCATERVVSGQEYTDVGPNTAKVAPHYQATKNAGSNTTCPNAEIVPLTSTKKTLTDKIATLDSDGSTAGQIGLAWGWYAVSPNWNGNGMWTGVSQPAVYGAKETIKVVVLMTDGAFNTNYCKGVSSYDSFGNNADRINCNATNGDAFDQAKSLCAKMQEKKIVLYTVGFNIGNNKDIKDLLSACASKPQNVYLPSSGTALKDAFKAIGADISQLRISK